MQKKLDNNLYKDIKSTAQANQDQRRQCIVYEPMLENGSEFFGSEATNDLAELKKPSYAKMLIAMTLASSMALTAGIYT